MKTFIAIAGAALLIGGTALAGNSGNVEYRPAPGVNLGGHSGVSPGGIPPECAAKTNRDDMKDCIKEKAQERGKARMMKGQGRK